MSLFSSEEVLEMIALDGEPAVFHVYAGERFDAAEGKVVRGERSDHSVTVVPPNAGGRIAEQFGNIDGVREAQLFSAVAAHGLTFVPYAGQEFAWGGRAWVVTWTNPVRDRGGVLMYEFGIKAKK